MDGDGGDSDDGGYGIPSQMAQHCHRRRLFPQPQAAGSRAQALHKGSPEGTSGTRSLLARCSVLHPAKAGCKNRGGFFQPQGWLYEPRKARKAHACTERLQGVLPQGGRAQIGKALSSPPRLPPVGQDRRTSLCCGVSGRDRGYPDIAVTTVITVTRPLCKRNQPALFLPAVRIPDMVVS